MHTLQSCACLQCRSVDAAFQVTTYIFWMSNKVKGFMGSGLKNIDLDFS